MLNEQSLTHNTLLNSSFLRYTLLYPSVSSYFIVCFFVGVYVCLLIFKASFQHAGKIAQTEVPTQLKNTHQNFREQIKMP